MPLQCSGESAFRGVLPLLPGIDYRHLTAVVEGIRKGQLERLPIDLRIGHVYGAALETEAGWKALSGGTHIDIEYLRSRRFLISLPSEWMGEPVSIGDWAILEGDHFCDRPRGTTVSLGNVVSGLGESLELTTGPYNNFARGRPLAHSLTNSGEIQWIERIDGGWELQFRRYFELGPDHAIWVWLQGEDAPRAVERSDCDKRRTLVTLLQLSGRRRSLLLSLSRVLGWAVALVKWVFPPLFIFWKTLRTGPLPQSGCDGGAFRYCTSL